ncbi:rRNA maturation RNase YbeY [Azoarcus communis]|uniref:Endoribonuclease YbeY n=2 Tax=Parazoarcus communis TaxID=41977 RepID=A0A323V044_9RHOO|nr:rRNA maturation RNase YbeY [Parazoarcus communis]NMG69535.1 rRNA maturation RNase YbeY [Parazoarcus communis SWub3 = DSM 12120]PZA17473.1 rRNA maturation RNase YbeY [Azoarcus communis] [Parazoarcus communis SWub3 = DSM 12120]
MRVQLNNARRVRRMAKQAEGTRITAFDDNGKATRMRAERIEIELSGGRRLTLSFPPQAWGDLELEADTAAEDEVPVITLQSAACNVVTLRVDVHHDMQPVESIDLPVTLAPPMLNLEVQKVLDGADRLSAPKKHQIRRWAQAALLRDVEVTVRLVGEDEGRELNRGYRGKDYATNVLTFVYGGEGEGLPAIEGAPLMGDLVLCVPVVVREAAEQGKSLDAHFAHLVVHGMLHLQGFDHEVEADAEHMEAREREILRGLGYADPYA